RPLVTTLTKRMAQELTKYLVRFGARTRYLPSDVDTRERVKIMQHLRAGMLDVLVGVKLLREALDLPELRLVAMLDGDKEGFLRNHRSLTQTSGRAARNVNGKVIMYADKITDSMQKTIDETERRRTLQIKYNTDHNKTPQPIVKKINVINTRAENFELNPYERKSIQKFADEERQKIGKMSGKQIEKKIAELQKKMEKAAQNLDFIESARFRDMIRELKEIN